MDASASLGLRERKRHRTHKAIQAAALELVARQGYASVSVDDIAEAAEVSRSTFFNYFTSKEEALAQPAPELVSQLRDLCAAQLPDTPLEAALLDVITTLLADRESDLRALKSVSAASPELDDLLHSAHRRLFAHLEAWALEREEKAERGTLLMTVRVFLAATETCVEVWDPERPIAPYLTQLEAFLRRLAPQSDEALV